MALLTSLELETGITLPTAYFKITGARYSLTELTVDVQVFASQAARLDNKPTIKNLSYALPAQETISMTSLYIALKLEIPNTTDC